MKKIPNENREWKQYNNSDLDGNIFVTKNITFDQEGYLKLSNSPRAVMDENIDTNFNNPATIIFSDDFDYFAGTWDNCFQVDREILAVRPTIISGAPSGDIQSDAVFFGGLMAFSQDNDLDYYDPSSNTWVDTNISLTNTSQSQHPIVNFLSLSALAVANVNTVRTYSAPLTATPTLLNTLTLPADFYITQMCYHNQNLYIATMNRFGGKAAMFVWNGQGSAAQSAYEVDPNIIFSICPYGGSVAILTGNGFLGRFNGSGFDPLGHFPIYYTDRALTDETNIGMYKNIMKANGDLIYILFTDRGNNTLITSQPDGIWCYDPKVGLHHRYSLSNSLTQIFATPTSSVNTSTGEITVSAAPITGTEIFYKADGGTVIGGLVDETKYFVIKVDTTHIKLATTKANALLDTAITLTDTGNSGQKFIAFPNVDFGQFFLNRTMSLCVIERPVENTQYGTDVIWGAEVEQRTFTGGDGMLGSVSSAVEARGYFITPKIFSDNVTDTFNKIVLKYSEMTSELDKIIVKYRTIDDRRDVLTGMQNTDTWRVTWTSTTTFTTVQPDFANATIGDEVEFLSGAASGLIAHITAISGSGTYTVTIDEAFENYQSGDKSVAVFRNWKKWTSRTIADTDAWLDEQLGETGKFIQFKIELRGLGVRIEEFSVDDVYHLPSVA